MLDLAKTQVVNIITNCVDIWEEEHVELTCVLDVGSMREGREDTVISRDLN